MTLTNRIRELRFKNSEMTQKHLAGRVGISRQTMNAIENGRHAPTIDVAIRIADVFGMAVDRLFDLHYEGRPVRRARATTNAVEQSEGAVEESGVVEDESEPAKESTERQVTMADLAKVIDS